MSRTDPRPHYGQRLPRVMSTGYVREWNPEHPLAGADGYVLQHRRVAWDAGLITDRRQHVHHRNGDKLDNRPENLEAKGAGQHAAEHLTEAGEVRNQYGTWPLIRDERERARLNYQRKRRRATGTPTA